jgi:hypothetical protein
LKVKEDTMLKEKTTPLEAAEIIARAKAFFADRVPHYGAYLEHEGPTHATFRGQGGEEIAIAVVGTDGHRTVRGSSPLYGQAVARFFSTLPSASGAA